MYMCCVHVYHSACQGQRSTYNHLLFYSLLLWDRVSRWTRRLPVKLQWLVRGLWGPTALKSQAYAVCQILIWIMRIWTRILVLVLKASYPVSHLSNLMCSSDMLLGGQIGRSGHPEKDQSQLMLNIEVCILREGEIRILNMYIFLSFCFKGWSQPSNAGITWES